MIQSTGAEIIRLMDSARQDADWRRWGPYLAERQWATVREDYSADGDCWRYFPHDQSRSRTYRWGEDGLLGICDRDCRLCFALALWNGHDPILKERLFGLSGPEGNHGEDVKEEYFYLDSTPTHSYMKALYKYPQREFPYQRLLEENRGRRRSEREYELADTGLFDENRYFDVLVEYAKGSPEDLLIRITAINRGPDPAILHLLPTLWYRNTWAWHNAGESGATKPRMRMTGPGEVTCDHARLGRYVFRAEALHGLDGQLLFTENETNLSRVFGAENYYTNVKDAFHEYVIRGVGTAVNMAKKGTKAAAYFGLEIAPGAEVSLRCRLAAADHAPGNAFGREFDQTFEQRIRECDQYWAQQIPPELSEEQKLVIRQACAGLLWSKQFYHYNVQQWFKGDPAQPAPPGERWRGRNRDWLHLNNRAVVLVPDKWEYPWYAAWNLALQAVALADFDRELAMDQLINFLHDGYMHPGGKLAADEFGFDRATPPLHAWACWRVYCTAQQGQRDRVFLRRAFHRLLINYTWWCNRRDRMGLTVFTGGFLSIDGVGVLDSSQPLPSGEFLDRTDALPWLVLYNLTMLAIAIELAGEDESYEDVAVRFLEQFVMLADAVRTVGGEGLWDENAGFYIDRLRVGERVQPLRARSLAGLVPLMAAQVFDQEAIARLPALRTRMEELLESRPDLVGDVSFLEVREKRRLLALASRQKLQRALEIVLDEQEMLSAHGVRSLSRRHVDDPVVVRVNTRKLEVRYTPGESDTPLFGGNVNWRGPVWVPINFLLIEALRSYHEFYGDSFKVECPTGSGRFVALKEAADEISRRVASLFMPDASGRRPINGDDERWARDPNYRGLILFHEYFDGDSGRGLGANHQGWTALVARLIRQADGHDEVVAPQRVEKRRPAPTAGS